MKMKNNNYDKVVEKEVEVKETSIEEGNNNFEGELANSEKLDMDSKQKSDLLEEKLTTNSEGSISITVEPDTISSETASSSNERDNVSEIIVHFEVKSKESEAVENLKEHGELNDDSSQLEVEESRSLPESFRNKDGTKANNLQSNIADNRSAAEKSAFKNGDKIFEKPGSSKPGQDSSKDVNSSRKDISPRKTYLTLKTLERINHPSPSACLRKSEKSSEVIFEALENQDSPEVVELKINPVFQVQMLSKTQAKRIRRKEAKKRKKQQLKLDKTKRIFQSLLGRSRTHSMDGCQDNQSGNQGYPSNQANLPPLPSTSRTGIEFSDSRNSSGTSSRSRKRKRSSGNLSSEIQMDHSQYQLENQGNPPIIYENQPQYQEYSYNQASSSSSTSRTRIEFADSRNSSGTSSRSRKRIRSSRNLASEIQMDHSQYQSANQENLPIIYEDQPQYQEYSYNHANSSSSTSRTGIEFMDSRNSAETASRSQKRKRRFKNLSPEIQMDHSQYQSANQGNLPIIYQDQPQYQEYSSNQVNLSSQPSTSRTIIESLDSSSFSRTKKRKKTFEDSSSDSASFSKRSKRDRSLERISFSKNSHLVRVIMSDGFREAGFTNEEYGKIKSAISYEIDQLQKGPIPRFNRTYIKFGGILVESVDEWSRDWLTDVVPRLYPWIGARLRAVELMELISLQKFHRAILRVPGLMENPELVLRRIEKQNPTLKTGIWRIYSVEEFLQPREYNIVLGIPNSSMIALGNINFKPYLGLSKVNVKITEEENPSEGREYLTID